MAFDRFARPIAPVPRRGILALVTRETTSLGFTWRQPREVLLTEFPREFAACFALDEVIDKHKPSKPADQASDVLMKTFARSTKSFRGTLLLAGHGFGPQAGMLARTLFEDMLIAHYVKLKPEVAERLEPARLLLVDRWREALEGFGRHDELDDVPDRLTQRERKELQQQNPGGRWTGLTIAELVDEVEQMWPDEPGKRLLRQVEKLSNLTNNAIVHHSPLALEVGVRRVETGRHYMLGADFAHVQEALGAAFFSYSNLLTVVLADDGRRASEDVYNEHVWLWIRGAEKRSASTS
jgi:hypothetical protein